MVDDVTTHPATALVVACYAAWYDRHFDPQWQDRILTPPDDGRTGALGVRHAEEHGRSLWRMGRSFQATLFFGAGTITHRL